MYILSHIVSHFQKKFPPKKKTFKSFRHTQRDTRDALGSSNKIREEEEETGGSRIGLEKKPYEYI